jgi:FkbM family methyltransferase
MTEARLPLRVRLLEPLLRRTRPAWLATYLKRLFRIKRLVVQNRVGTFLVDPISHLGTQLIRNAEYEPDMSATLARYLSPGSVFVDIGANEGYFTIEGGRIVGPSGRVVAVEPQVRLRAVLDENLRLNGLENVTLFDAAVSDAEGPAEMCLAPDMNTGASSLMPRNRYRMPTQPVRTTTLTRLFADAGLGAVDLMKMDIEGLEYEAVMGSKDLFRVGGIRVISLELHLDLIRDRGHDPEELVRFLHSCGYRMDRSTGKRVFVLDRK